MSQSNKPKALQAHEIEGAIDEIIGIIWEAAETKKIEFLHLTVGLHKDGKQIRVSFPKKEKE